MTSDGSPWRPIVHIEDICQAMLCALDADPRGGGGREPSTSAPIPATTASARSPRSSPGPSRAASSPSASSGGDTRSYRVSFAKIREHMPDFETAWDAERGARQLSAVFERIGLTREMFEAEPFTRLKELKHLRATGQIDERLHWRALEPV